MSRGEIMKSFAIAPTCLTLFLAAGSPASAQPASTVAQVQAPDSKPQSQSTGTKFQAQPPAIRSPATARAEAGFAGTGGGEGLAATLAKAGKFNSFLGLLKVAGWNGDGKAGIVVDDGSRGVTILAPNDAAFAAMDKAKLAALMNDQDAARAFISAHVVSEPLKVTDLFYTDNPTSEKFFRSAKGGELKLLCDGRAHVGLHHPRINDGMARVGDIQDVAFDGGMIQEIDGILAK